MFCCIHETTSAIIPGEVLPVGLGPRELVAHTEFPTEILGLERIGLLTGLKQPEILLKSTNTHCLHYLHKIQSLRVMGKLDCLHTGLTPVKADCPEADKRVRIRYYS